MRRFRYEYGAGPLHLMGGLASFLIAGYGFLTYFDGRNPIRFLIWFALAIALHDFVFFPLYTLADRLAQGGAARAGARSALNHVRVPALLSGLLLVIFFPLILQLSERAYNNSYLESQEGFLSRWLLITGVLFAVSGLLYAVRRARAAGGGGEAPG